MATFNVAASADDGGYYLTTFSAISYYHPIGRASSTYGPYYSFYRFINVNISKGSIINSAYITFTAAISSTSTTCNVRIYGNDADNAVAPTNIEGFQALTLTTAYADWLNIESWTQGSSYNTPSLTNIIQEITDRASWQSGNALMFMIYGEDSSTSASRGPACFDSPAWTEPILTVTWTEPSGASFTQKVVMF